MSVTVVLEVTPRGPLDPDRYVGTLPDDLDALLAAAGQDSRHGLSRRGGGPWRLHVQLSGVDRLDVGRTLLEQVRGLGYDVDLRVSR